MRSIVAFIGGSWWRCRIYKEGVAAPCFLLTYIIVIWTTGRDRGTAHRVRPWDSTQSRQIVVRQDRVKYKK